MSTIINGTSSAITFPDTTVQNTSAIVGGYVPYANLPTGSVLQVVQGTYATQTSNFSTSYTNTGLSASITPKFSTSKILVLVSISALINRNSNGGSQGLFQIVRGATAVYNNAYAINAQVGTGFSGGASVGSTLSLNYLDSPSTTSLTTYAVQNAVPFVESGYAIYTQYGSSTSTIILMEIAG